MRRDGRRVGQSDWRLADPQQPKCEVQIEICCTFRYTFSTSFTHKMSLNVFGNEARTMLRDLKYVLITTFSTGNRGKSRKCASFLVCWCTRVGRSCKINFGPKGHEQDPPIRFYWRDQRDERWCYDSQSNSTG